MLHLLDTGAPPERIKLWHHLVDGREGSTLMDWPCTEAYVRAFARALGLAVYFSWRVGGFDRELLREDARTAPIAFETPDGVITAGGRGGRRSTRRKYPQTSADPKIARTIAGLNRGGEITTAHVSEAIPYRSLDRVLVG